MAGNGDGDATIVERFTGRVSRTLGRSETTRLAALTTKDDHHRMTNNRTDASHSDTSQSDTSQSDTSQTGTSQADTWNASMPSKTDTGASTVPALDESGIRRFFSGIPHWTAGAGLSPSGAESVANELEQLGELLRRLPIEPTETDGPDPAAFPPPSDRIAAAGATIDSQIQSMTDAEMSADIDGRSVVDHCRQTMQALQDLATTE